LCAKTKTLRRGKLPIYCEERYNAELALRREKREKACKDSIEKKRREADELDKVLA
jgi:hypothetical protein